MIDLLFLPQGTCSWVPLGFAHGPAKSAHGK